MRLTPQPMYGPAALDDAESEAMDHLITVMRTIVSDWNLSVESTNLRVELAAAIHVIQGFIVQHMLERIAPQHWGTSWYGGRDAAKCGARHSEPGMRGWWTCGLEPGHEGPHRSTDATNPVEWPQ